MKSICGLSLGKWRQYSYMIDSIPFWLMDWWPLWWNLVDTIDLESVGNITIWVQISSKVVNENQIGYEITSQGESMGGLFAGHCGPDGYHVG